ncbi:MAG: peptide-methionine (S)-S-oxide reductase MsrA [Tannerella sp.]|jgi:methionine-S-sulfoxide reductase|nr:peptide-methionine (S)-S-oxide reductase MsrA [Tannerella sp.]
MEDLSSIETAYFASGCFWGTEYHFLRVEGVLSTTVGFMGGHVDNPTYKEVYTDTTGHAEVVKVEFDHTRTSYEELVRLFFETHDFTQTDGQGPDIGTRYRSVLFVVGETQAAVARKYVDLLTQKGYQVATKIEMASTFYPAEEYHQQYYDKTGGTPYCHIYRKIF